MIDTYGCNPCTVFEFSQRKDVLKKLDTEIKHAVGDDIWETHRKIMAWENFEVITNGFV